jgi:phycoerythrin-associated linker protein
MFTRSYNLMRDLGGMKVAISDNAQGRQSKTINALTNALRESTKPQPFSYVSVTKIPVKLPQQQYTGHNPPAASDYVPFRPFGVFF